MSDTQRAPTTKRNATTPATKERPLYHAHTPLEIGSTWCLSGEGATGSGPSPSCGVSTTLLAMEKGSLPVSNASKSTCALPKEKGSTCARLGVCELRLIGASERVGGCDFFENPDSTVKFESLLLASFKIASEYVQ